MEPLTISEAKNNEKFIPYNKQANTVKQRTSFSNAYGQSKKCCLVYVVRPGSVDSLNGGSTDAMKKAPVGK